MLINLLIIFYLELVMNMKDFFESGIYLSESEKGGRNHSADSGFYSQIKLSIRRGTTIVQSAPGVE